ncbi:hypothetical protein HY990_00115 [Candidatus Micrarchaeota archaeon]|nr:hypothetical protein [Candidatus Micrarchaeota archaeon]
MKKIESNKGEEWMNAKLSREAIIVEASAHVLKSKFHTEIDPAKARGLIERNRGLDRPMLYAGANYDLGDFLATGCRRGVFVDPQYGERMRVGGKPATETYREDFERSLKEREEEDAKNFSMRIEGDIKRGGRWLLNFEFCGEQKSVVCYGADVRLLGNGSLEPPELADGVAHYTTVHFPTEWANCFLFPGVIGRVVAGGHMESGYPIEFEPLLRHMGFEELHSAGSREAVERRCGRMSLNGVSVYEKLRKYAILRREDESTSVQ